MRIVVALGGNALLERGERPDELLQRHHVVRAARALARLAHEHELVVCHGNGPQVGILAVESSADGLAPRLGWSMARDGAGWRRVVASPEPGHIVEIPALHALVESDAVVICGGGGGVPVAVCAGGGLRGVEAVVDKDLTAALIAQSIDADLLLVLTAVAGVMRHFGHEDQELIRSLTAEEASALDLPAGSMGPKVEACRRFVTATRGRAGIGLLDDAEAIVAGHAGTLVVP